MVKFVAEQRIMNVSRYITHALSWQLSLLLYFQAYLSLPEGTASVVGLIAMMTDHYSNLVRLKFNFNLRANITIELVDCWILFG